MDITNPLEIQQVVNRVKKEEKGLYGLVNNAGVGDTISIEGTWTNPDTVEASTSDDNLIITADSDSAHPGYEPGSPTCYRLEGSGIQPWIQQAGPDLGPIQFIQSGAQLVVHLLQEGQRPALLEPVVAE